MNLVFFLVFLTLCCGNSINYAELDNVKQTYHFEDVGIHEKCNSEFLSNKMPTDDTVTVRLC
jgi:hypothetical protein